MSAVSRVKQKMGSDPILFGKICFPGMFSIPSAPFHYELAEAYLNTALTFLNIIAPRGHAKSSLVACVFVLHHLLFAKGKKFIVLVSKTEGHAKRLLETVKNALEYSGMLRLFFGYHGEHAARKWTDSEIVLDTGDCIMVRGTGQQVVGLKHGDQRPTFIVLDDPEDMNNTKTKEAMEFNLRWLLQALLPCRDAQVGRVLVIGTPQHERCMIEMLKEADSWTSLIYKALNGDGPLIRENAANLIPLWPEQWDVEKLLTEKAMYESINRVSSFYREFQCEIIGDEDQLFRESMIQYWDGDIFWNDNLEAFLKITFLGGVSLEEPKILPVNVFTGIDPASSVEQTADYSVIMNIAIDKEDFRYTLPFVRKRLAPMDLAQAITDNFNEYHSTKTQIESVGYQEMLRDFLRRQSTYIPGLEVKNTPRTQKSKRLEVLQPWFAGKKVFIKRGQTALVDEMLLYPRGKNDDLLDGLYYSFKGVWKPYHEYHGEQNMQHSSKHLSRRRRKKSAMTA